MFLQIQDLERKMSHQQKFKTRDKFSTYTMKQKGLCHRDTDTLTNNLEFQGQHYQTYSHFFLFLHDLMLISNLNVVKIVILPPMVSI